MSKIILLNGCGSSGKTSIARSIQHLSNKDWLTFGVDTFIEMTPYPSEEKGSAGYFEFVPGHNDNGPTMRVESRPKGEQLFGLMPELANMLAHRGNNVIIDEVLFDDAALHRYVTELSGHTVYFVGVKCDLYVMQEREFLRRNRAVGLANDQIGRVHEGVREYDVVVDTTNTCNFELARKILAYVDEVQEPTGFRKTAMQLQGAIQKNP